MVRYVESSPADQVQPKTFERQYTKPGDALDKQERVLVDVDGRREMVVDPALFANPYSLSPIQWRRDSRAFTFEYNQRGHQALRLIEVNGSTGSPRALIDETSDTFIDYRRAAGGLGDGGRTYRLDMNDGAEIIWMSSRDGWAHLYLYDGLTGPREEPDHEGQLGRAQRHPRRRGRAADLLHGRRRQPEAGPVLRARTTGSTSTAPG